jgi:hypothetical protein
MKIYKTITLPVSLYGYEILSLVLREEHRFSVFENRVLRRKFGPETKVWLRRLKGQDHSKDPGLGGS